MRPIKINTEIDHLTQKEINSQFNDNFKVCQNLLQTPAGVSLLPANENGLKFVRAGVVMMTDVTNIIDYDNPQEDTIKKIVLDDFASKILTLFRESPHSMRRRSCDLCVYIDINRRWFENYPFISITHECKKVAKYTNYGDKIGTYVQEYIEDYMKHEYIGRGVEVPTVGEVINWCGGGEFPFLVAYLIRNDHNDISLCYYLER